jgi:diguanylate cyclase (GGDEF)-like protein
MREPNSTLSGRTFLAGKIISNFGASSIDCVVRRMSDEGATVDVESPVGIPSHFHLLIAEEGKPRPCKLAWQSERQLGLKFEAMEGEVEAPAARPAPAERSSEQLMRGQFLALRAALDEIQIGVVLLDSDLRAQFINKAFRAMWKLPDAAAERRPSYVALLYHGRDTNAYQIPDDRLDAHVAERVRVVRAGEGSPTDLRLTNGEVIRVQCIALPNGGRMLSYTPVTDIVRHSDELELLRSALDNVPDGIALFDADLNALFLNRKVRQFWGVSDEQAAARPSYASLIANAPHADDHGLAGDELKAFFESRIAAMKSPQPKTRDLRITDGRTIRAQSTLLDHGHRMINYCDITDLVRNTEQLERLATVDVMTGLHNRRHFLAVAEAEWDRFQRYPRPLSVISIDIDHFKAVNDRYGEAVGDDAIMAVAHVCLEDKRVSDIVGRIGGEEFALLLPETDLAQARIVADRICSRVAARRLTAHQVQFNVTVSIGVATATADMSGVDILMSAAGEALHKAKSQGRNRAMQWSPAA